jgi:hypothetical protein
LNALEKAAAQMGRLELSLLLTLLLLVFYPPRYLYISLPLSVIALVAILMPPLRHSRLLWLLAALLVGASAVGNWQATDNHKYLLAYWCLAIACSLCTRDPGPSLARIARWLVAAVFSIAVLQKLLSRDYLNSDFFYFALLFDERFAGLAKYVGGVSEFSSELNESARRALVNYDSVLTAVKLSSESGSLPVVATFVTWWTVLLEAAIGVAYLAPQGAWLARWRHPMLLLFVFSTYLFAPVIGFGWLMIIIGVAQLDSAATRMRLAYLLSIVVLQAYKYPWPSLFDGS